MFQNTEQPSPEQQKTSLEHKQPRPEEIKKLLWLPLSCVAVALLCAYAFRAEYTVASDASTEELPETQAEDVIADAILPEEEASALATAVPTEADAASVGTALDDALSGDAAPQEAAGSDVKDLAEVFPLTQDPLPSAAVSAPTTAPTTEATAEPSDEDLVRIVDYIPSIVVELKYATEDNFTGTVIYDFSDALLRYGTVKKLAAAQEALQAQGYSLKIWDAYRPVSAQFTLWAVCPDPTYVANPNTGASSHSKGSAVDVTLVDADGIEVVMPTGFDDFSALADRDYSDASAEAAANALLLENTMTACGFKGYSGEWWHFSDTTAYSVVEE